MVVLTDLIQREQYSREVLRASIRKSVFWGSGLIVSDTQLTEFMQANVGKTFEFDFFNDLADNEGRISDDSDTKAGTDNIGTGSDVAVANYRNRSWGAKNITANLSTTGDPLLAIAGRVGAYWARQMDATAIAITNGIVADNVANDGSDMVNNRSGVETDINMIIDTKQTAGDAKDMLGAMICHSAVQSALSKAGVTDKVYSDKGEYLYDALIGLRLVVTDSVPTGTAIPGGAAGDYMSYIVGTGMYGYGEGTPKKANDTGYDPTAGNGAGEETLWSRKNFCIHPYGFKFNSTTVASTSPTNAEFALAVNWTRTADRKTVPFAALISSI